MFHALGANALFQAEPDPGREPFVQAVMGAKSGKSYERALTGGPIGRSV